MLASLAILVYALVTVWVAVMVHEVGHFLIGVVVGVPARSMRVRIVRPPHVALRHGHEWLSPDDPRYIETFRSHAPSAPAAWLFVAGGFLLETALTVGVVHVLAGAAPQVGLVIIVATTGLLVLYVMSDLLGSRRPGRPTGDLSALLRISVVATIVLLGALTWARVYAIGLVL